MYSTPLDLVEEKSPHRSLQKNWQKKIGEKNVDKIRKKSICEQSKVKHPIAGGEIPPLQSSEDLVETSFCRECDTGSNIGIIRENLPKTFLTDITQITSPPLPPNSGNLYIFFFKILAFGIRLSCNSGRAPSTPRKKHLQEGNDPWKLPSAHSYQLHWVHNKRHQSTSFLMTKA